MDEDRFLNDDVLRIIRLEKSGELLCERRIRYETTLHNTS